MNTPEIVLVILLLAAPAWLLVGVLAGAFIYHRAHKGQSVLPLVLGKPPAAEAKSKVVPPRPEMPRVAA